MADFAGVGLRTVQNAEDGKGVSSPVATKIQESFEQAGVEFLTGDGVRMRETTIEVHDGEDGILALWDDIYETIAAAPDKEILITNNTEPTGYSKRVADYLAMHLERLENIGATEKIIAVEGDSNLLDGVCDYRYVAAEDFCDSPTFIYADKLALLRWGPPARVIILREPLFTESLRKLFGHAWKHARTAERRK